MKFVVYLTTYTGYKLPPYYIGSTSKEKLDAGYFGSVTSRKWKTIYKEELINNKNLFSSEVLSYHNSRQEALDEERKIQIERNVIKSSDYFNEAIAAPNGFFGRDVCGELHPMFGKTHTKESRDKISKVRLGKSYEEIHGDKANDMRTKRSESGKIAYQKGLGIMDLTGENNPMYGKSVKDIWIEKYGLDEANKMWDARYANMKGKPAWNSNKHKVQQFDKENNLVAEYEGLADVIEKNPQFNKSNICNVLKGKRSFANGYNWKLI